MICESIASSYIFSSTLYRLPANLQEAFQQSLQSAKPVLMKKTTKMILVVAAIAVLILYAFVKFGKHSNTTEKDIPYGPFTVRVTTTTGKTFNMNYGMVGYSNSAYSILHNGKPVAFPGRLQNNTGLPFLWKVYALPGAPDPTLIAGSQSLYLVYLKDGVPVVKPLLEQGHDFASLQFLDSNNGQPAVYSEVFMSSEVKGEQLDSLEGGRFLMVSEHAVLDVQTRECRPFNVNNNSVENYSFPVPHGALAFSPDRKSIVFMSAFQSWNTQTEDLPESEHALVVYNYEKDNGYAVKFDDTELRVIDITEADQDWVNTFFEWKKTPDGDQLHARKLDKLPNWTGRFNPRDNYYTLYPVKPGMLPVFLDFVLDQMGWTKADIVKDETGEYTGRRIALGSGNVKLDICLREDDQSLSFSKELYTEDNPDYPVLVKKIADAFDAKLTAGEHQEHFGRILNQTKVIRGH